MAAKAYVYQNRSKDILCAAWLQAREPCKHRGRTPWDKFDLQDCTCPLEICIPHTPKRDEGHEHWTSTSHNHHEHAQRDNCSKVVSLAMISELRWYLRGNGEVHHLRKPGSYRRQQSRRKIRSYTGLRYRLSCILLEANNLDALGNIPFACHG